MKRHCLRPFFQAGLSLVWASVLAGMLALLAMLALMSWRYERNFFSDLWKSVAGSTELKAAHRSVSPPASGTDQIRRCVIDGKTVYSNVDCSADDPGSRAVEVRASEGFEAPKAPVASAAEAPISRPAEVR